MIASADAGTRKAAASVVDAKRALALARRVLDTEARAITSLADRLSDPFVAAIELMLGSPYKN